MPAEAGRVGPLHALPSIFCGRLSGGGFSLRASRRPRCPDHTDLVQSTSRPGSQRSGDL